MRQNVIKYWHRWLLAAILLGAFVCRLYRLTYPLFDWHSFRQADTASVTREFWRHHYPIWLPHYHDLSDGQSGLNNPEGYRFVEFPLINYLLALLLWLFAGADLVVVSRLAAALASTVSVGLLYWLVVTWSRHDGEDEVRCQTLGLLAASVGAFLPYTIYYGRVILPEPFQVFFILLTLVCFTRYLDARQVRWWWGTLLALAVALLVKPTSVFAGPVLLVLAWRRDGWRAFGRPELIALALLALAPLLAWRQFITRFPEGIPESDWLLNGVVYEIDPVWGISNEVHPRWRPLWWRWIFYERLGKMYLGYIGLLFAGLGLLPRRWRGWRRDNWRLTDSDWLVYGWWVGLFAYVSVFATGNIRHDYYQYLLWPAVAYTVARGLYKFCELFRQFCTYKSIKIKWKFLPEITAGALCLVTWWLAWQQNGYKFDVNNWNQVRLGRQADALLPADALVIAHTYNGDTNFLFQTGRRGWPFGLELEKKIAAGAQYFIGTNTDDLYHHLREHYQLLYQDDDGYIFALASEATASAIIEGDQ